MLLEETELANSVHGNARQVCDLCSSSLFSFLWRFNPLDLRDDFIPSTWSGRPSKPPAIPQQRDALPREARLREQKEVWT